MKSICLTMIVKDEIKVIERCLNSIKDSINYWVIYDTGSTDGTQDCIKRYFLENNIEGELHEVPWKNFGYNRTLVFEKAKNKGDYYLVIDADDILKGNKIIINNDDYDSYYIEIKYNNLLFKRKQLFSSKYNWKYIGVLHEYAECEKKNIKIGTIKNCYIEAHTEGSRSINKDKYKKDVNILLEGIKNEPNNIRYYFYLANSYYDSGDYENAKIYYQKRILMNGWDEEIYYSLYKYALCNLRIKNSKKLDKVLYDLLQAFNYRPTRLEALYEIVKYYRLRNPIKGYAYGMLGYYSMEKYPEDILFVNEDIHKYKFMDELAVCASWAENYILALKLTNKLLAMNLTEHKHRLKKNKDYNILMLKKTYNITTLDDII